MVTALVALSTRRERSVSFTHRTKATGGGYILLLPETVLRHGHGTPLRSQTGVEVTYL